MSGRPVDNISILVVDDEADVALIMKLMLQDAGYDITTLSDPVDIYSQDMSKFLLALVDLKMPKIDGFEVMKYIHENNPLMPVVIVTAHGSEDIAVEAMKRGAADYIAKPFSSDQALHTVSSALTTAKNRQLDYSKRRDLEARYDILQNKIAELETSTKNTISNSIEFDEYSCQAGISILSYFSTVIKQKYPLSEVKVRIEQEGNIVRLIVVTPEGEKEKIEKTLEDYGLVVVGQLPPQDLLPDPLQILQLRHKLEMAAMEITHTKQLLHHAEHTYQREISRLNDDVAYMKLQIADGLKRELRTHDFFVKVIEVYSLDGAAKDAIIELSTRLEAGIIEKDKEIIIALIAKIHRQNFSAFEDLKSYFISSLGGASGNLLSNWFLGFLATLPR